MNFDQISEDESNTIGFIKDFGGTDPPSKFEISGIDVKVFNDFGDSSRLALLFAMMFFATISFSIYKKQYNVINKSKNLKHSTL